MPLTSQQKQLIVDVDNRVKILLANGGNEEVILIDMLAVMPDIKTIMYRAAEKEMDLYAQEYDGFYHYMKLLDQPSGYCQWVISVLG